MLECLLALHTCLACGNLDAEDRLAVTATQTERSLGLTGQIIIYGNESVPDYLILRELRLYSGGTLSSADLKTAERVLVELHLFKKVSVNIDGENEIKDIHIRVAENAWGWLLGHILEILEVLWPTPRL